MTGIDVEGQRGTRCFAVAVVVGVGAGGSLLTCQTAPPLTSQSAKRVLRTVELDTICEDQSYIGDKLVRGLVPRVLRIWVGFRGT